MLMAVEQTTELQADDYWSRARHPLTSLVFLLPLLLIYEAGVIWLGGNSESQEAIRNGADSWMRHGMDALGFRGAFLLPLCVATGLMIWQIAGRYPWRISPDTLAGMLAESILFAFCLIVLGQLQDLLFQQWGSPPLQLALQGHHTLQLVSFVGAGVYEEVLFRLCLLPGAYGLFRATQLSRMWAAALAVVSTSLLFSIAHYIGPAGEPFALFSFVFRATAGCFFAGLFLARGFGVTVGCHAFYDILVGLMLTTPDA